ncbi:basic juvenile hormone-suppressible protein 1-like [Ostrinia nubilalis]|uniref:basic juvenile hormone-suppressible protein 1-like n=1 Tax=Ostrinia nubilalis TaxID=29057 RepID=UPI00308260C1
MKLLVVAAFLAVACATVIKDDFDFVIKKENLVNVDVKTKEMCLLKLLNHILQPTMYDDVREIAREWTLEDNIDKYLKADVVKNFADMYKNGMLPRGEVFVHTNEKHLAEVVRVFKLLYFAKDFDVFLRTACWLRERINGGMFVYALTVAVFHRPDCIGIVLPAPYEIYPYFFVDDHIINKAFMVKMTKAALDPVIKDYYGIKVTDNNIVVIDWRKGVRHTMTEFDRTNYFTEDIDLNTYMYYLHMNYPYWMTEDVYNVNKERRGEIQAYTAQQLLARLRLERLGRGMCDIRMLMWNEPLKEGYWPKIRMHNGESMPVRQNHKLLLTKYNVKEKILLEDIETIIREGILKGKIELRDGTTLILKKPEDIETLARLVLGGINMKHDHAKVIHVTNLFKRMLSYSQYNLDKYTYVPTALDMYTTCLRDPLFWKLMKRIDSIFMLYKNLLPRYSHEDLDFAGVKIEHVMTDKLVTFMDEYDVDITNAMYLDKTEMQKKRSDMVYVARMRRLNHHPFKVTVDVVSDKAVDAVVRVFIGPKYDCMGRLLNIHDIRHDMVEIDSFLYKLDTGKNTIVRDSLDMHGVIQQRPWTRHVMDRSIDEMGVGVKMVDSWWYKTRMGFPHRLLLPLGNHGGLPLQMFVIVTPVRTGLILPSLDMSIMKERHACRWTTCIDTMPLGFPFDREIDESHFFTKNMKFTDIRIFRKDLDTANMVKDMDMSEMVMKHDDYTYLDTDMLMRRTYKDVMLMSVDNMTHM